MNAFEIFIKHWADQTKNLTSNQQAVLIRLIVKLLVQEKALTKSDIKDIYFDLGSTDTDQVLSWFFVEENDQYYLREDSLQIVCLPFDPVIAREG